MPTFPVRAVREPPVRPHPLTLSLPKGHLRGTEAISLPVLPAEAGIQGRRMGVYLEPAERSLRAQRSNPAVARGLP